MHPSRRRFIKKFPAMTAIGLAKARAVIAAARRPQLHFPTSARERLAVTSYPFGAYIIAPHNRQRDPGKPGIDLKQWAAQMADEFGIRNINPVIQHFQSTDPSYLASFRKAIGKIGVRMVDLGLEDGRFYDPDPVERRKAIGYGQKGIEVALALGSPSVRQHVGARRGVPRSVRLAAESLGRLADYGARHNIVVNLENDSPTSEDPFFLVAVIEKANNPYLRALPDFGNSIRGHDNAYNERALEAMFRYALNMSHVKEHLRIKGGLEYHVDLPKIFAIARASSYRGYFSMEHDSGTGDPYAGTQQLVDVTLKYVSAYQKVD
jgi:sugar phosphate isomerase/epimerase